MEVAGKILFCAFGAAAIAWGFYTLLRAWQSAHWPRAIGTIVSSQVEEYRDSKGTMMYRADICYRYSVSGKDYTSRRRIFGGEMAVNWPGPAEAVVAGYPEGATVSVHYDPGKPAEAVLLPGQYRMPLFSVAFGALFLLAGLFLW